MKVFFRSKYFIKCNKDGQEIQIEEDVLLENSAVQNGIKNAMKNFILSDKNKMGIQYSEADEVFSSIPIFQ